MNFEHTGNFQVKYNGVELEKFVDIHNWLDYNIATRYYPRLSVTHK